MSLITREDRNTRLAASPRRWRLGRRRAADSSTRESPAAVAFALGLLAATVALVWLGYVATREWSRSTVLLHHRLAAEVLALADEALARDMKGAWTNLIVPVNPLAISEDPPYDLLQQTAQTFARFPYPESSIVWKEVPDGKTYAFNRADRQPPWDTSVRSDDPFPVVLVENPPALNRLVEQAREYSRDGRPFTVFDIELAGTTYQVVAHLMFSSVAPQRVTALAAFTVDLGWVRREYFGPLLAQVARIGGSEGGIQLAVFDQAGRLVTTSDGLPTNSIARRPFPLVFLEPGVATSLKPQDLRMREWTLQVGSSADPSGASLDAARWIFALIAVAALAAMIALIQTLRAVRATARLAAMKSEFVSAVTHELKTPLALIRLVADTLGGRRYSSPDVIQEYASLLSRETARLGQSLDYLLTFARYTDLATQPIQDAVPHDVCDLVEDALERFRLTFSELGFHVSIDVPRDLPRVFVDGRAIVQALEIVIDNAVKYSHESREISVTARREGKHVKVTITDRGIGVAADDLPHVFERFFRGRNVKASGSGLGLAIARRILRHNRGDVDIRSAVGLGTEVDCLLPAAA